MSEIVNVPCYDDLKLRNLACLIELCAHFRPALTSQVALDIEYHRTMVDLHLRVNPKEVIVGWYSTGAGITDADALIQASRARSRLRLQPRPHPHRASTDPLAAARGSRGGVATPLSWIQPGGSEVKSSNKPSRVLVINCQHCKPCWGKQASARFCVLGPSTTDHCQRGCAGLLLARGTQRDPPRDRHRLRRRDQGHPGTPPSAARARPALFLVLPT